MPVKTIEQIKETAAKDVKEFAKCVDEMSVEGIVKECEAIIRTIRVHETERSLSLIKLGKRAPYRNQGSKIIDEIGEPND